MSLTVVREDDDYGVQQDSPSPVAVKAMLAEPARPSRLQPFEGEEVHGLRAKLTSATNLELGEDPHRLDETVRMLVTGRVTRVDHVVDERTGQLNRVETFKVVEAMEVPWDSLAEVMGE